MIFVFIFAIVTILSVDLDMFNGTKWREVYFHAVMLGLILEVEDRSVCLRMRSLCSASIKPWWIMCVEILKVLNETHRVMCNNDTST